MEKTISKKDRTLHELEVRDSGEMHHTVEREDKLSRLIQTGDMEAVQFVLEGFAEPREGKLSDDPLTNIKYFYVCTVTLICRYAMLGGVEEKEAFYASDRYIHSLDNAHSSEEVINLLKEMTTYYVTAVKMHEENMSYSKPIRKCINYIYYHLNESISIGDLATTLGLNRSYLSTLFKKEVGITIKDYIREKKLESAASMLSETDIDYVEISTTLAISSQSYFIKIFKNKYGMTPREYRNSAQSANQHNAFTKKK